MANALLLDIALFLKSRGVVTDDGVDLFRDFTPEAPDNIVVLYEYRGDPVLPYEASANRSVQISVRDVNADIARSRALSIFRLLNTANRRVDFTSSRWGLVYLRQTPFKSGQDTHDRVTYIFNIGITTAID